MRLRLLRRARLVVGLAPHTVRRGRCSILDCKALGLALLPPPGFKLFLFLHARIRTSRHMLVLGFGDICTRPSFHIDRISAAELERVLENPWFEPRVSSYFVRRRLPHQYAPATSDVTVEDIALPRARRSSAGHSRPGHGWPGHIRATAGRLATAGGDGRVMAMSSNVTSLVAGAY